MASAAANADMATEKQLSPVEKLEKQDKRNKEIAVEKTVADAKKQILDVDMSGKQIHAGRGKDDIFLPAVVSPQGTLRGIRYRGEKAYQHLEDEEKMNIIANLTVPSRKPLSAGIS